MKENIKLKEYTYPRVHFDRQMEGASEVPMVVMIFTSLIVKENGEEEVAQMVAAYTYFGKRDVESEMMAADDFHNMCRDIYFTGDEEEVKPIDEDNITFNEDDERW